MKLTADEARLLANALLTVYERWEQNQIRSLGICYQVAVVIGHDVNGGYALVNKALVQMGALKRNSAFLAPYTETWAEWEPRATMCLLMREWLIDEYDL